MGRNSKAVKAKISSVKSTKKITRSMQMISAAKMQKTVSQSSASRSYTDDADQLLKDLARSKPSRPHALMKNRKVKNELMIILSSNRGLCGSFNANVLNVAESEVEKSLAADVNVNIIAVGKNSAKFAAKRGLNLVSIYEKLNENPEFAVAKSITDEVMADFKSEKYDKVTLVYTKYITSLRQEVEAVQLLPVNIDDYATDTESDVENTEEFRSEFVLEPNAASLLSYVLPKITEAKFFQAVLDSAASEHSSRMIAMKNATDAATDMIDSLTLEYNKSRQAAITQEIAEITAGAEALN